MWYRSCSEKNAIYLLTGYGKFLVPMFNYTSSIFDLEVFALNYNVVEIKKGLNPSNKALATTHVMIDCGVDVSSACYIL